MENGEWDELPVSGGWDSWLFMEDGIASSSGLLHLSLSGGYYGKLSGGWDGKLFRWVG